MLQLCQGAHAIILPVNLALKIVFRYHKSGKYVNTAGSSSNSQSLHCLCIYFTKSYLP